MLLIVVDAEKQPCNITHFWNFPCTNKVAIQIRAIEMLLEPFILDLGNCEPLIGWWDSDLNFLALLHVSDCRSEMYISQGNTTPSFYY
jgi:hypothetical protein